MNEQLNERRSAIDNTKAVIAHAQFLVVRVRAGVDLQRTLPTALRCAHLCCSAVRRSVRRGHSLAPSLAGSGFHSYHNTTPCKTWKGSSHNSRPKIHSSRRPRLSMRRLSTALIHAPSRGLFLGPAHVCLQALRCPPERLRLRHQHSIVKRVKETHHNLHTRAGGGGAVARATRVAAAAAAAVAAAVAHRIPDRSQFRQFL